MPFKNLHQGFVIRNITALFTILLIILTMSGCNFGGDKIDSNQKEINVPRFTYYFNSLKNFSGNVLVAIHGKPIYKKSFGHADLELDVKNTPDTKFRIGSLTKQFTSMAVMILVEQGKINIDDKISNYLPDLPKKWQNITVHQLLTHTSGIMHSWALTDFKQTMMLHNSIEQTIDRFRDHELVAKPGEKYQYSGVGYFLLSTLIEKVSGQSYCTFLKEEIFDKAGMPNSGCDEPEPVLKNRAMGYVTDSTGTCNAPYIYMPILTGGGNLYSTLDDLLAWDRALFNNTLITPETKNKMFTPELVDYAYGWHVTKSDSVFRTFHTGGVPGFSSLIDRYPDKGILIVILSNNVREKNPEICGEFSKLVLKEKGNNNEM